MYSSTFINFFLSKINLIIAFNLLDNCKKLYVHWLLNLLNKHIIKQIL